VGGFKTSAEERAEEMSSFRPDALNTGAVGLALFFFSSRRRHTRWPRDWSSDVCSSDLRGTAVLTGQADYSPNVSLETHQEGLKRSEERRVGKEGRSRWSPNH